MTARLDLQLMEGLMAVCRLAPSDDLPVWAFGGDGFRSVTRTADEWSVVCPEEAVPPEVQCERGWRIFQVAGPLDFGLTGIASSIAGPLADAAVSVFLLSTYDTDYVMVKADHIEQAAQALQAVGHRVLPSGIERATV